VASVLQLNTMRASPFACHEIVQRNDRAEQYEFVGRSRSVRCTVALFQSPMTGNRNLKQPTTACHHSEQDCVNVALGDVLCWFWLWLWCARRGAVCSTQQELAPGPGMWSADYRIPTLVLRRRGNSA